MVEGGAIIPAAFRMACLGVLVGACLQASGAESGKLADFEKAATKSSSSSSSGSGFSSCLSDPLLMEAAGQVFFNGLFYGGAFSVLRLNPDAGDYVEMPGFTTRQWGEALIPYVRVDGDYEWAESDVEARNFRVEAGAGPLAFQFNRSQYEEESPDEDTTLTRLYGVYRMSFGDGWEVDVGLGEFSVEGDNETDFFSLTLPVLYHPWPGTGIEFRPAWSENVEEYDLGLLVGWRFASVKGGYRYLRSDGETLKGPYLGLSVHF